MANHPTSLGTRCDSMRPHLEKLKEFVVNRLKADISGVNVLQWRGRVKSTESILQKLQTGDYSKLEDLKDLAAITIVVQYRREVQTVLDIIKSSGLTIDDSPAKPVEPTDFRYREPKLFVQPPPEYIERNPELNGLFCEVQVTTALQNALDATTHDFDYKGRAYSWTNFRLVAQLRGMLELVDKMIDDIESVAIAQSELIAIPQKVLNAEDILSAITSTFEEADLPSDRRRLADTVALWLEAAGVEVADFQGTLDEFPNLRQISSIDVSSAILGALVIQKGESLVANFDGNFVVSEELESFCPEVAVIPVTRRVTWAPSES